MLNLAGAMVGVQVANTMAKLIHLPPPPQNPSQQELAQWTPEQQQVEAVAQEEAKSTMVIIVAGLLGAAIWAASMTVIGMPISGSHSLIGGIVGSAVAASGVEILVAKNVGMTLVAMAIAPVLGMFAAYMFYGILIRLTRRLRPSTMDRTFGKLQVLSAS